ncbi:hypothetical protein BD626DRAFT_624311 [Schizophyllum amplum]|uniref:Uncharacterized protein n=1 Tax=Schizophyllum amplum TaxID=97359 RepID=A0A550CVN5_9AGAR|nr:hypothetical protein BD626DRAFT_624311 [Auriculariopsis ampla]
MSSSSKTSSDMGTSGHDVANDGSLRRERSFSIVQMRRKLSTRRDAMKRAIITDNVPPPASSSRTSRKDASEQRGLGRRLRMLLPMRHAPSDAQLDLSGQSPLARSSPNTKRHVKKMSLASLGSVLLPRKSTPPLPHPPHAYVQRSKSCVGTTNSHRKRFPNMSFESVTKRQASADAVHSASVRRNRLSMLSSTTTSSVQRSDQEDSDSWRRSVYAVNDDDDDPFRPPTPTYLRGSSAASSLCASAAQRAPLILRNHSTL